MVEPIISNPPLFTIGSLITTHALLYLRSRHTLDPFVNHKCQVHSIEMLNKLFPKVVAWS